MPHDELNAILMPDGTIQLEWIAASGQIKKSTALLQTQIYQQYSTDPAAWLFLLGFSNNKTPLSTSLGFWRRVASQFVHTLQLTPDIEDVRDATTIPLSTEALLHLQEQIPMMPGAEYLQEQVLLEIWQSLNDTFSRKITAYTGTVADFFKELSPDVHLVGRIYFHLVENKDHDNPFAFLATYASRLNAEGESKHLPLQYALEEYEDDNEKLLELLVTVDDAAEHSALIAELRESGELFHPLAWTAKEAFTFLQEIPLYEESGILCRIPDWWKGKAAKIGVDIQIGDKTPATLGMNALLDFTPRLLIGDTEISEAEARRLLRESAGLVFIKNKWVAVDPEKLQQTLAAFAQTRQLNGEDGISFLAAMRLSINPQNFFGTEDDDVLAEVSNGEWLQSVFTKLHEPQTIDTVKTDRNFKAKLRAYQQDGLQWLYYMHKLNFGACLADDMGLGKTVQVLAFLNAIKNAKGQDKACGASLLIIPASLLGNWQNEIDTFFPSLVYFAAHPDLHKPGKVPALTAAKLDKLDLVITTYALAQRYEWLQDYPWNYIILDEAQAIKNPGTKQTRAVKKLSASNRIIMTGTPVENRLSDLWSLFDFLNPGLLGNAKEFTSFSKGLATGPRGYAALRKVVSPFILRRLKSDKTIIADLPDKVEVKTWAAMSKKQTVLYRQVIESIKESIENSDGIQRKGLILAAIMKFKQLCNHPDQYLGLEHFAEKESGKFMRLREICETIYEKREKVLIFTQFKEMTAPLALFLADIFKRPGLVLHGSVPVGKRKKLVDEFQSHAYVPFFVLSLKAGGVGLNLTAANHVIHFDRWWNPAVENQATDRAYRIGQQKNVMVHKFLTKGTIEEKIDAMLTQKTKLSNEVVAASGENWLTEMDNAELLELFTLQS